MRKLNSLVQIITVILLLSLVCGIAAVLLKYTNGGTTDLAVFYVKINGEEILSDTVIGLKNGETYTFEPSYLADKYFSAVQKKDYKYQGFNVTIKPNITVNTKFDYTIGGNKYRFEKLAEKDFCEVFGLKRDDTSFVLKTDKFSVADFISTKHSGQAVTLPANFNENQAYFNLIISSYDEKNKIVIGLKEDKTITFSIDGKPYTTKKGITFGEWFAEEDCPFDFNDGQINVEDKMYYVYDREKDGIVINPNEILIDKHFYYAVKALSKFTVGGKEFYSLQNMTWESWINSSYNTGDFGLVNGVVAHYENGIGKAIYYNERTVSSTDIVVEGGIVKEYTVK